MPRIARVVAVGVPHHVTQRGNSRQPVFLTDTDHQTYVKFLREWSERSHLRLLGYCLMTNHVHLVVIPDTPTALAKGLGRSHYLYAREFHARHSTSGHLWQNRFFSAPLDRVHLIAALRYVDHNPVRAGIVVQADAYRWSSARAHVSGYDTSDLLDMVAWQEICPLKDWENLLQDELDPALAARLRQATKTGRPCGEESFVTEMETHLDRRLHPLIGGRPVRPVGTVTRFSAESA